MPPAVSMRRIATKRIARRRLRSPQHPKNRNAAETKPALEVKPLDGGLGSNAAVAVDVATVRVLDAPFEPGVTDAGLKAAVAPTGKPEAESATLLSKGLEVIRLAIAIEYWTEAPCFTSAVEGVAETLKSGATGAAVPVPVKVAV
jgi:hypothetical protein